MIAWFPRWIALVLLALPFVPAVADDPDDKEIARLVKQLGSSDYHTREKATKRLAEISQALLDALDKAAASDDAEVRGRADNIRAVLASNLSGELQRIDLY